MPNRPSSCLKTILLPAIAFLLSCQFLLADSPPTDNKTSAEQKWSLEYDNGGPNTANLGFSVGYNLDERFELNLGFSYREAAGPYQSFYCGLLGRYNLVTDKNIGHDYFQPFAVLGYGLLISSQQLYNSVPPEYDVTENELVFGFGCEFLFGKCFGIGAVIDGEESLVSTSNIPIWLQNNGVLYVQPNIFFRFRI